jgi:hypothetical protein
LSLFVLTCYCSNYGCSFCYLLIVARSIVLCRTIDLSSIRSVACTPWSTSSLLITGVSDVHNICSLLDSLTMLLHSHIIYVSISTPVLFIKVHFVSCDVVGVSYKPLPKWSNQQYIDFQWGTYESSCSQGQFGHCHASFSGLCDQAESLGKGVDQRGKHRAEPSLGC